MVHFWFICIVREQSTNPIFKSKWRLLGFSRIWLVLCRLASSPCCIWLLLTGSLEYLISAGHSGCNRFMVWATCNDV